MRSTIHPERIRKFAGLELNALRYLNILPANVFEGARISGTGTPIYDINGQVLFHRIPLDSKAGQVAYADMAADIRLAAPVLSVSYGQLWDEKAILKEAAARIQRVRQRIKYDEIRFTAYSYPKIALQFLFKKKEVMMLEWASWDQVPAASPEELERRKKCSREILSAGPCSTSCPGRNSEQTVSSSRHEQKSGTW